MNRQHIQEQSIAPTVPNRLTRTFTAFQYPNYRLWFLGQAVSLLGTWMQSSAQGFLIFQLTKSDAYLGYVSAAALPSVIVMLYGGVVADRVPRRTLLIVTQISMMILAFILAVLTFTGMVQPWHLIILAFLLGIANAFDAPARQAFILELVERPAMTNAIALNAAMFNIGAAFGPAVAGLLYAQLGPAWCFTLNGLSFLAVIGALAAMQIPPQRITIHTRAPLLELKEGLLYTVRHPIIRVLVAMVGITGFLGISFATLFPVWATEVLHGDAVTNGWLQTARGIGALLGALSIAVAGSRLKRGQTMSLNLIGFPIILILFSFVRTLPLSLLILVGAGMTTILVFNLANALVQTHVPDELRGRVMGIYTLVFFASTPLGSFIAGQASEAMGAPTTILINACLLLIVAVVGRIFLPQIKNLE